MGFYSQTGEDVLLSQIFRYQANGVCLEIGALDGVKDSTTLHFEEDGWCCVLVEANPELAEQAKANRRGPVFSCAAGDHAGTIDFLVVEDAQPLSTMILSKVEHIRASGFNQHKTITVPLRRLDTLLEQAGVSRLDFATIDVEGAELEVLRGLDLNRWNPRVLVVEDNTGGRDRKIRRYLRANGYRCFLYDGLNDWYARKSDPELLSLRRRFVESCRQIKVRLRAALVAMLPDGVKAWLRRLINRSSAPTSSHASNRFKNLARQRLARPSP